jgi:hypothetical protein
MLNALDLTFTMPKQKLLEVLCQRWHKDQPVWWRGEDGCSLQFQNSEIWGSPIVSPRKAGKKKKIQVLFCRLFRRHEVHYLSGFLLPAMLQLMANFALLWFHNCDWLFEYRSCLSDWWDDREVIAETSCQVRLSFFAILPQEYCINFASLVVKCCQIDSIAQISD